MCVCTSETRARGLIINWWCALFRIGIRSSKEHYEKAITIGMEVPTTAALNLGEQEILEEEYDENFQPTDEGKMTFTQHS